MTRSSLYVALFLSRVQPTKRYIERPGHSIFSTIRVPSGDVIRAPCSRGAAEPAAVQPASGRRYITGLPWWCRVAPAARRLDRQRLAGAYAVQKNEIRTCARTPSAYTGAPCDAPCAPFGVHRRAAWRTIRAVRRTVARRVTHRARRPAYSGAP